MCVSVQGSMYRELCQRGVGCITGECIWGKCVHMCVREECMCEVVHVCKQAVCKGGMGLLVGCVRGSACKGGMCLRREWGCVRCVCKGECVVGKCLPVMGCVCLYVCKEGVCL